MTKRCMKVLFFMAVISVSCSSPDQEKDMGTRAMDMSQFSSDKPIKPIHLLFIHHSTGGALLADKGEKKGPLGKFNIYESHPNGGGLRRLLEENNYVVHEASYGSVVAEDTDVCHWNRKFRDHMNDILVTKRQDEKFTDGTRNRIVIFKSCFPNSWITSDGKDSGDPESCERTTVNYRAVYRNLLEYFSNQPDTLFVVFTAPPMAEPKLDTKSRIMDAVKGVLAKPDTMERIGNRARSFNNWLKDVENGWLKGYALKNVVVFDYYDVLTDHGKSNWSLYPTRDGRDSHPSSEGQTRAAQEFVPFLNRAAHRIGI